MDTVWVIFFQPSETGIPDPGCPGWIKGVANTREEAEDLMRSFSNTDSLFVYNLPLGVKIEKMW